MRTFAELQIIGRFTQEQFDIAVQREVDRLKREGRCNAYICERSFEIEDAVIAEFLAAQDQE